MKKLFALCLFCFLATAAFGQGSVYSTTIYNRIGQAMANASFATCTNEPTGTSLCQGTTQGTTYTDITLGTPCTNVSTATGPTSGLGCTNPGLSDSLGNVIVFGSSAIRWGQISGYLITPQTIPFAFPATSSSSIAFNSITAGTNTNALRIGTGGTFLPTGTGQIAGTGLYIQSPGVTAPSPVNTSTCPTGNAVFEYGLMANSTYQPLTSWNTTISAPPTAPAGTITHCWREWWDDSGVAGSAPRNRLIGVGHIWGHGGVTNSTSTDESAIAAGMANTDALFQNMHQALTFYGENNISGTPTFGGHAGGEVSASVYRGNLTLTATSITGASGLYAFSAAFEHDGSSTVGASGGYHSYITSNGGSGSMASAITSGYDCAGSYAGTETNWVVSCFSAAISQPRFPGISGLANIGYFSSTFGTNANDYDLYMAGVNSAGTPSGFNSLVGPTFFGNLAHVTAGYQVEILGAAKHKAAAGVSLIDLFGSTSGHAGISVPAAAGTPNPLLLPTTTATATTSGVSQAVISDGASPQQLAYQWHAPVMSASGTIQVAGKIVKGRCTLGTDCSITLTGNAVFTSSSTYECSATDTTAANAVRFNPSSGSAFALTGTGTDVLSWICTGN